MHLSHNQVPETKRSRDQTKVAVSNPTYTHTKAAASRMAAPARSYPFLTTVSAWVIARNHLLRENGRPRILRQDYVPHLNAMNVSHTVRVSLR